MNSQRDPREEIRSKLRRGLQSLSEASQQDQDKLGMALIAIHSALEDFIRSEVARKAPELRERIEDVRQTRWNQLLDYGRVYLGFTAGDCSAINDANTMRLKIAHGRDYNIRRAYLVEYASLVERLCNAGQPLPVTSAPPREKTAPAPERRARARQPSYTPPDGRPWYRSTVVLVLTFFFAFPLWAVLILTDRNQGCLPRLVAYSMLLTLCFAGIGFAAYFDLFGVSVPDWLPLRVSSIFVTDIPDTEVPVSSTEAAPPVSTVTALQPASGDEETCTIIWTEYTEGDLSARNRSMVWEEVVVFQVKGSGMTHKEFFDLVVEHNPELKTDGFEFKKGKTYLLPKCR
jgi:hypothetical protein